MQNEIPINASAESLTDIVAIVGENYNQFVKNLQVLFPRTGKAIAQMLVKGNQDRLYHTFNVYKKRAKVRKARLVYSPRTELKILQGKLEQFVSGQFIDHATSHGFVVGKSTRTAAEAVKATPHLNEKEATNLDIKGAFPAISGRAIRTLFRHRASAKLNNWQINILTKIATNSADRLATGAPSSPTIFNWRLTAADKEIEKLCQSKGWKAVRYADDITIIHYRTQKKEVIEKMTGLLEIFDLKIERSKLKTFRGTLKKITGITVQNGQLRISRQLRRTHRAIAHRLAAYYPAIVSRNVYDCSESYQAIKAIPEAIAYQSGTPEAQAKGFWAYVIHTTKPLKTSFNT